MPAINRLPFNWKDRLRCAALVLRRDPRPRIPFAELSLLVKASERIPGWTRGREAMELANLSYQLPKGAVVVEIGCFLGSSTILLAGARKLRGDGVVHCVDPFDGSGDEFSRPHYDRIAGRLETTLRAKFDGNICEAGLNRFVEVHQGTAEEVGRRWKTAIDFLFLDGDHSPEGARTAFERWTPFVRRGGLVALHNTSGRPAAGHDGFYRLARRELQGPEYQGQYRVGTTSFATKST